QLGLLAVLLHLVAAGPVFGPGWRPLRGRVERGDPIERRLVGDHVRALERPRSRLEARHRRAAVAEHHADRLGLLLRGGGLLAPREPEHHTTTERATDRYHQRACHRSMVLGRVNEVMLRFTV